MAHDDFAVEPVRGLPERPPVDEVILWQGKPDWWALTKASLALKWVVGYFVVLGLWRFVVATGTMPVGQSIGASLPFLILAAIVACLLMLTAYVQASATVYTLTNRRVAMRIGAALTITLNIPFTQIANANLDLRKDGTGTIAFEPLGQTRLSYLVCWPHVRPWRFRTEPALRCIPDARKVAQLFAEAAQARVDEPRVSAAPAHAVPAE